MNDTPDFGWYYRSVTDRAPAFTGVEPFWSFMTASPEFVSAGGNTGPFGEAVEGEEELTVGDVVQLINGEGQAYHTLLVTSTTPRGVRVAAHSIDAFDRPLSDYRYASARFLHLVGVRVPVSVPDCFSALIEGRALPMVL
jgi:hypothetical protein